MLSISRLGKKKRPKTRAFQIKHQILIWWLKHQAAKAAAQVDVDMEKVTKATDPIRVQDASL